MALNPNHTFEDLGEVKCAVVEKNCTPERVSFLKDILEYNGFEVVVVAGPPPKAAKPAPAKADAGEEEMLAAPAPPPPPETFTVGVTDVTFSPVNAVFNRELRTREGKVVTSDHWKQIDKNPGEEVWYWKS